MAEVLGLIEPRRLIDAVHVRRDTQKKKRIETRGKLNSPFRGGEHIVVSVLGLGAQGEDAKRRYVD